MKISISNIKKTIKAHPEEFVSFGLVVGSTLAGFLVMYLSMKKDSRDDVVIPAAVIKHMMQKGEKTTGFNVVEGFNMIVEMIPNK